MTNFLGYEEEENNNGGLAFFCFNEYTTRKFASCDQFLGHQMGQSVSKNRFDRISLGLKNICHQLCD